MSNGIDKLIINCPYQEPNQHWLYEREKKRFRREVGRRSAGYIVATPNFSGFDDPGIFVPIELANKIRKRVGEWRKKGYPGVTGVTKRLLEHWTSASDRGDYQFFFCQLEAIETLIWLVEAPEPSKVGIEVPKDGGPFERWCNKMATGSGKTVVMAMIIAWNFLNKVTYPTDKRFSKHALVIAPGLTVKHRLKVLQTSHSKNYYETFNIVPASLREKLRQGEILILNWHALAWDTEEKIKTKKENKQLRSVDKRQHIEISQTAYARKVLSHMASAKNIVVINDEAHHAWRINPEAKKKYFRSGSDKDSAEEATIWINGLDRIHAQVGILRCFDLSATPFSPSGGQIAEETLFPWVVSDFGLNDAIESGLVKTPRVAIQDNTMTTEDRSRLYHIYSSEEIRQDFTRKAKETEPLPNLVVDAYNLLGQDWISTKNSWQRRGHKVPPVMITVANRTETAARIKHAFDSKQIDVPELCEPEKILQIDSRILKKAEMGQLNTTKQNKAKELRLAVDTIGELGSPGEQFQNVISVGMLSEGWDAKTVTHIMGLRAFSSQLLCEQVVGRGLRRVSYDTDENGLFTPEYVNIFGVPFTFLPYEDDSEGPPPAPPPPKTKIEPIKEKSSHQITWPNVIRIDHILESTLSLDVAHVTPLQLDPHQRITEVQLDPIIAGKPHSSSQIAIRLDPYSDSERMQTIIFRIAALIYSRNLAPEWSSGRESFLAQLVQLVEKFIAAGKVQINSVAPDAETTKMAIHRNMMRVVQYVWSKIQSSSAGRLVPVFDTECPHLSTADAEPWYTTRRCEWMAKSHINFTVVDSDWELHEAISMNRFDLVHSFVKNDHLGFAIQYMHEGKIRRYIPDFIVRLTGGRHVILETKGQDNEQVQAKKEALDDWVKAVNGHGSFGEWYSVISFDPKTIRQTLVDAVSSLNAKK